MLAGIGIAVSLWVGGVDPNSRQHFYSLSLNGRDPIEPTFISSVFLQGFKEVAKGFEYFAPMGDLVLLLRR